MFHCNESLNTSSNTMNFVKYIIIFVISVEVLVTAAQSSHRSELTGSEERNKTSSQVLCVENEEYPYESFCCKNCEAGTRVDKPCSGNWEKGTCVPCESNTYTEHLNGMRRCLQCTTCRKDQVVVEQCIPTRDTQCQCKPGTFCEPEQACEVCKKCSRCKDGEEEEQKCTSTSNTVCRRGLPTQTTPTPPSAVGFPVAEVVCSIVVVLLLVAGILFVWFYRKKLPCFKKAEIKSDKDCVRIPVSTEDDSSTEEQQNSQNARIEEPRQEQQCTPEEVPLVLKSPTQEDEDKGLGDSLPNTTSSSQTSSPRHSPETHRQCVIKVDVDRKLSPLDGEVSLMRSFDFFGELLGADLRKRFFRGLGVNDNIIKTTNTASDDGVYELLKVWMQREGLKADINDLIKELLNLNQKYTAEKIIEKVIEKKLYKYDDESY